MAPAIPPAGSKRYERKVFLKMPMLPAQTSPRASSSLTVAAPALALVSRSAMQGGNGGQAYGYGAMEAASLGQSPSTMDAITESERNHVGNLVGNVAFVSAFDSS